MFQIKCNGGSLFITIYKDDDLWIFDIWNGKLNSMTYQCIPNQQFFLISLWEDHFWSFFCCCCCYSCDFFLAFIVGISGSQMYCPIPQFGKYTVVIGVDSRVLWETFETILANGSMCWLFWGSWEKKLEGLRRSRRQKQKK